MRKIRTWTAAGVAAIALGALAAGVALGSWGGGTGTDAVEVVDGTVTIVDSQYWIAGDLESLCEVDNCNVADIADGSWRLDFGQHDYFLPTGFSAGTHTIQGKLAAHGEIDVYVVDGTPVGRGEGEAPPWGGPDADHGGAPDSLEAAEGGDPLDPADDAAILALDTDLDGCINADELGDNPGIGGLRDPLNPWDYFNPTGDRVNRTDDVLAVVDKYGANEGEPAYSTNYDRGDVLGPNPWNLAPPNGTIRIADILAGVDQYGHDCA